MLENQLRGTHGIRFRFFSSSISDEQANVSAFLAVKRKNFVLIFPISMFRTWWDPPMARTTAPYFEYSKRKPSAIPHSSNDFGHVTGKIWRYTQDWMQRIKIAEQRHPIQIWTPKRRFPVTFNCIVWTRIHCFRFTIKIAASRNQLTTHRRWPIRRWTWNGSTRNTTHRG